MMSKALYKTSERSSTPCHTPRVSYLLWCAPGCDNVILLGIPDTLYEDNVVCIARLKRGYIKRDWTKYISLKFFFTCDRLQNNEIDLANLFIKLLPISIFEKLRYKIGMCHLLDEWIVYWVNTWITIHIP